MKQFLFLLILLPYLKLSGQTSSIQFEKPVINLCVKQNYPIASQTIKEKPRAGNPRLIISSDLDASVWSINPKNSVSGGFEI